MTPLPTSPYRAVLGAAFDALPPQVRAFHGGSGTRSWDGTADIRRGGGWPARAIASVFGFPQAGSAIPTTVTVAPHGKGERWTRDFGGRVLRSVQSAGAGRDAGLLVERFGPVRVGTALLPAGDGLRVVPRRWSLLGVPMPARLLPSGGAIETETDGCFGFDVTIRAPLVGLIVAYRGTLRPADGPRHGVAAAQRP